MKSEDTFYHIYQPLRNFIFSPSYGTHWSAQRQQQSNASAARTLFAQAPFAVTVLRAVHSRAAAPSFAAAAAAAVVVAAASHWRSIAARTVAAAAAAVAAAVAVVAACPS